MFGYWILFIIFLVITTMSLTATFIKIFVVDAKHGWGVDWQIPTGIVAVIAGIITFVFMFMSIFMPLNGHDEYLKYSDLYPLYCQKAEMINNDSNALSTIGQNKDLIRDINNYNEWLASARASKGTYGIFSSFYKEDLDHLDYVYLFTGEK